MQEGWSLCSRGSESNPSFQLVNKPSRSVHTIDQVSVESWLVHTVYHLLKMLQSRRLLQGLIKQREIESSCDISTGQYQSSLEDWPIPDFFGRLVLASGRTENTRFKWLINSLVLIDFIFVSHLIQCFVKFSSSIIGRAMYFLCSQIRDHKLTIVFGFDFVTNFWNFLCELH